MIDVEIIKKAILLTQAGKTEEAEDIYEKLLSQNPNDSVLLSTIGLFYVNIKDYKRAAKYLKKACEIKESLGTVSALGFAEYEQGNYAEAASVLEHALTLGENSDIYNSLVTSLFNIKQYKKAIEYTDKMNELYPNDLRSIINKIKALTQLGKMQEAEKLCVETLKNNMESASLWTELGFLKELIYVDDRQAKECYKQAAKCGNPFAYFNIAVSCGKLGEYEEAEENFKKVLQIFPDDEDVNASYGMCLLKQRKFKEGYEYFYRRSRKLENSTTKWWKPYQKLEDSLIIYCDQGLGDHIQFIRYLPFLGERKLIVKTHKSLKKLFSDNYPNIEFVGYDFEDNGWQHVRITDLAFALGMDFEHIPLAEGYLNSETADIKNDKLKVGLCWEAGAAGIRNMIQRTINVKYFDSLMALDNIQVYSFQYTDTMGGNNRYPNLINLAKDFNDFSDTARALKAMNVVITVDTSVAHLSGALGIKTFLLIPYVNDWRWFDDDKTTPWYKSVKIFKQTTPISWEEPINEIIKLLK